MKGLGKQQFAVFVLVFLAAVGFYAFGTISVVPPERGINQTRNYFEINVSSNETIINGVVNWTNQSGQMRSLSPTEAFNSTFNYTFWNITDLLQGVHNFSGLINQNGSGFAGFSTFIRVDSTAPSVSFLTPGNNSNSTNQTVKFNFNINDSVFVNDIAYKIYLDEVNQTSHINISNSTTVLFTPTLVPGPHIFTVETRDPANNVANTTIFLTITLAISPPTPANNTNQTQGYINFNVSSFELINTSLTWLEWTNQSGQVSNLSPTQVINSTFNYSFWNVSDVMQGYQSMRAYVWQNASQILSISENRVITIDSTAPAVSISYPQNGLNTTTFDFSNINFTLTDNVFQNDLSYKVYNNSILAYEGNTTNNTLVAISANAVGQNVFVIEARDALNNIANTTPITVIVSPSAPTTTFSNINGLNSTSSSQQFNFTITNSVFTADLAYKLFLNENNYTQPDASNASNNTQISINTTNISNGTYSVKVESRNPSGQIANSSAITLRVDTVAPVLSFNTTNSSNISVQMISFVATDNVFTTGDLGHRVYLDGIFYPNVSQPNLTHGITRLFTFGNMTNGTHNVMVEVRDSVNNIANSSTLSINYDAIYPTITFNHLNFNSSGNTTIINFSVIDNFFTQDLQYFAFYLNNNTEIVNVSNNTPTILNLTLPIVSNFLTLRPSDPAGNNRDYNLILFADTTPPNITFITPNALNTTNSTPEIGFNITEDNFPFDLGYKIFLNGVNNTQPGVQNLTANTTKYYNFTGVLNNGTNIVKVETRNAANTIMNSTNLTINIDDTAPTISISTTNATSTTDTTPDIAFTVVDGVFTQDLGYKIYVDGSMNSQASTNATNNSQVTFTLSSLSVATHTIFVEARDAVNNARNSTALTLIITATSSPPSGGSGGGGGGGGGAAANISSNSTNTTTTTTTPASTTTTAGGSGGAVIVEEKKFIETVVANENTGVEISHPGIGVKGIDFVTARNLSNVEVKISKIDSFSVPVPGSVYQYLEIVHANMTNSDIQLVTFRFNVSRSWLSSNGFKNEEVFLQRYTSSWLKLFTINISESGSDVEFQANSPGMSIFAITVEKTPSPATQTQNNQSQPARQQQPESFDLWIMFVVVVTVLAIILEVKYKSIFRNNDLFGEKPKFHGSGKNAKSIEKTVKSARQKNVMMTSDYGVDGKDNDPEDDGDNTGDDDYDDEFEAKEESHDNIQETASGQAEYKKSSIEEDIKDVEEAMKKNSKKKQKR